jgi:thiol-disulfide isomerase/thioredoxin
MISTDEVLVEDNYQLTSVMNESITLKAEDKTTVIYFFAPWCQVCHVSISNLQALYEKNEHIDVIAVALDYMNVEEIKDFSLKHQLTFPIALGTEQVKKSFKISGYPSYYVINEQNTVISRSQGYSSEFGLYLRTL